MSDTIRIHQFTELVSDDGRFFAQIEVRSSAERGYDVAYLRTGPVDRAQDVGAESPCWVQELGVGSRGQAVRAANEFINTLRDLRGFRARTIELRVRSHIDGLASVSRSVFEHASRAARATAAVRAANLPLRQWYEQALFS